MATITNGMVDYYQKYNLNKSLSHQQLSNELRKKSGELHRKKAACNTNGNVALAASLEDQLRGINEAMRVFKNKDSRQTYDRKLNKAYSQGRVFVTQNIPQNNTSLFNIEEYFANGFYDYVIQKSYELINNNYVTESVYYYLANSYYMLLQYSNAINTILKGIQVFPDSLTLRKTGARIYAVQGHDANSAQYMINEMLRISPNHPDAKSEQVVFHIIFNNDNLAFSLLDQYIREDVGNVYLRNKCAQEMLDISQLCCCTLIKNVGSYIVNDKNSYNRMLSIAEKAAGISDDPNVRSGYQWVKDLGVVQYEKSNTAKIVWTVVNAIIMSIAAIYPPSAMIVLPLVVFLFYSAYKLYTISYMARWEYEKYEISGQIEPDNALYIYVGNFCYVYFFCSLLFSVRFTFKLWEWMFTKWD